MNHRERKSAESATDEAKRVTKPVTMDGHSPAEDDAAAHRRLVEELDRALRARDEFISAASHDLRSPLQAVQVRVHMVQSAIDKLGLEPALRDKLTRDLESIKKNSQSQVTLLNEIVERTRGSRLPITASPVDLAAVTRSSLVGFLADATARGVAIEATIPASLSACADRIRYEQILVPVLRFALERSKGGSVRVTLVEQGARAVLTVEDDGPAVPAEQQERLFDRPRRADGESAEESTVATALYMVRKAAVSCGGSVDARFGEQAGCTVEASLPLQPPPM